MKDKGGRSRGRQSFVTLIFVSTVASAVLGDKFPLPSFFSEAFPVFDNFGRVIEEEYLSDYREEATSVSEPATSTVIPSATPTFTPSPTFTPTLTHIPTSTFMPPSATAFVIPDCPNAMPPRITFGSKARVKHNLNLRSFPEITEDNLLLTSKVGDEVEVVGNAICNANPDYPYLWWQVETAEGIVGWSAEASSAGNFYFLEPID